ncbi:MAG: VOC family protein [Pseudomonadota bacterium]
MTRPDQVRSDNHSKDTRPEVWVGHVSLKVRDFRQSLGFFNLIGMRQVARMPGLAVMELRGGTHLILRADSNSTPGAAGFDLMVDDLIRARQRLVEAGYQPTEIRKQFVHRVFDVIEPSGHSIQFNNSHVAGAV